MASIARCPSHFILADTLRRISLLCNDKSPEPLQMSSLLHSASALCCLPTAVRDLQGKRSESGGSLPEQRAEVH